MTDEHVGVVVVMYDSAALLGDLVRSLPSGLEGVRHTVAFVDNDSKDDSADLAAELLPDATVVRTGRNGGYAAGINAGIAELPHDVTAVLVLNPDVRLDTGCVGSLLSTLRTPGTGIAVPKLTDRGGNLTLSMRREPLLHRLLLETAVGAQRLGRVWDIGEFVVDPEQYRSAHVTDWAEGSTQLISKECLAAVGPWDESYFMFSEETEFGLRARDKGYATRFAPTAHATHLEGSRDHPKRAAMLWRNKIVLYRRRHGTALAIPFYLCVLLREATRAAGGRPTSRESLHLLLDPRKMRSTPGPAWLQGG